MTAQVAADLRAAAEVLRRDGWTRRAIMDASGRRCSAGAIFVATASSGLWLDAVRTFARHLGRPTSIVDWNDEPGRTADEVIAALEAAADAAEATA